MSNAGNTLTTLANLIIAALNIGMAIFAIIAAVQLFTAISDHNGPQQKESIMKLVGTIIALLAINIMYSMILQPSLSTISAMG
ncbi:MAG: hypothetical protein FWG21_00450 [Oscillospiraceae bacterium]|nr:hypothetical protein [Oscillospiraceae bacterium]